MAETLTFKVGENIYDIPQNEQSDFLKAFPKAEQVKTFKVDKDTFDIPISEVEDFKKEFPNAVSADESPQKEIAPVIAPPQQAAPETPQSAGESQMQPVDDITTSQRGKVADFLKSPVQGKSTPMAPPELDLEDNAIGAKTEQTDIASKELKAQEVQRAKEAAEKAAEEQRQQKQRMDKSTKELNYAPHNLLFADEQQRSAEMERMINDNNLSPAEAQEVMAKYDEAKLGTLGRKYMGQSVEAAKTNPRFMDTGKPLNDKEAVNAMHYQSVQDGVDEMTANEREAYVMMDELGKLRAGSKNPSPANQAKIAELKSKIGAALDNYTEFFDPVSGKRVAQASPDTEAYQQAVNKAAAELPTFKDQIAKIYYDRWARFKAVSELYDPMQRNLTTHIWDADRQKNQNIASAERVKNLYIQSKLEFDAAKRAYLLNRDFSGEERTTIGFKPFIQSFASELIPSAFMPEGINFNKEKTFVENMGKAMQGEKLDFSQKEKERMQSTLGENVAEGVGGLLGILPKLWLASEVIGAGEVATGLDKALSIMKTGSKMDRVLAGIAEIGLEEAKTQAVGFKPGLGAGFVLAGKIKIPALAGKLGAKLNPFYQKAVQGAVGGTAGMEAGAYISSAAEALRTDQDYNKILKENGLSDASGNTKRIISELIINSLFGLGRLNKSDFKFNPDELRQAAAEMRKKGHEADAVEIERRATQMESDYTAFEPVGKQQKGPLKPEEVVSVDGEDVGQMDLNRYSFEVDGQRMDPQDFQKKYATDPDFKNGVDSGDIPFVVKDNHGIQIDSNTILDIVSKAPQKGPTPGKPSPGGAGAEVKPEDNAENIRADEGRTAPEGAAPESGENGSGQGVQQSETKPSVPAKTEQQKGSEVDDEQTRQAMRPIIHDMIKAESALSQMGLTVSWDNDHEIQVRNAKGNILDPDEVPNGSMALLGAYEEATKKLGEYDNKTFQEELAKARGEEAPSEEVKKPELPAAEEESPKANLLTALFDEMQSIQKERKESPRKNDFDRQKKIIRLQNLITDVNKKESLSDEEIAATYKAAGLQPATPPAEVTGGKTEKPTENGKGQKEEGQKAPDVLKPKAEGEPVSKPEAPKPEKDETQTDTGTEERDTEVIINQGETASQAPEPTTPGERAEQVETITSLIDEIDAKIKGFVENYDTEGINHEYPNNEVGKRAKKDVAKYSKELASLLGWEHDTDRKGKVDYAHANIAPAGGDVGFILWKPNSNLGVYVKVKYDETPDLNYKFDGMLWRLTTKADKYSGLHNNFDENLSTKELAKKIQKEAERTKGAYDKAEPPFFKEINVTPVKQKKSNWEGGKEPKGASEEGPAEEKPKSERFKKAKAAFDEKADDAWDDFFGHINGKAFSFGDVEAYLKAGKLVSILIGKGLYRLAEIMEAIYVKHGEAAVRAAFQYIKEAYNNFAIDKDTPEHVADRMDDRKTIKGFDIEKFIADQKEIAKFEEQNEPSETTTEPGRSGQVGKNPTQVPGGEPSSGGDGTESKGSTHNISKPEGTQVSGSNEGSQETGSQPGSGYGTGVGGIYSSSGGSGENVVNEDLGGTTKKEPKPKPGEGVIVHNRDGHNFVIPPDFTHTNTFNLKQKYDDNIRALQILVALEKERRPANQEEQNELFKYVGFGGLKEILYDPAAAKIWTDNPTSAPFRDKVQKIHDLLKELDPENFKDNIDAIKFSVLNAHYTAIPIIRGIYDVLGKAGFTGGRTLEPSAGIGHFLGGMPSRMAKESQLHAIELDKITGKILKNLYQDANTFLGGYQESQFPNNYFDLVISNIPFGNNIRVFDPEFQASHISALRKSQQKVHNYFFAKALESTRPNGMIAFVTSAGVLDSKDNEFLRQHIADNAEFLGAIRLPSTAFKGNANTSVVTDIVLLRKRGENEKIVQKNNFIDTSSMTVPHKSLAGKSYPIKVNQYFIDHPTHVIGEFRAGGQYAEDEMTVIAPASTDVEARIRQIGSEMFPKHVYSKNVTKDVVKQNVAYKNEPGIREGNLVIVDGKAAVAQGEYVDNPELNALIRNEGFVPERIINHEYSEEELQPLRDKKIPYKDLFLRSAEPLKSTRKKVPIITDFINVRNTLNQLYVAEANNFPDSEIKTLRDDLNKYYDNFVKKHGFLNDKEWHFQDDIDHFSVVALERWDDGKYVGKADIFKRRIIDPFYKQLSADNPEQAMLVSLSESGSINPDRIAELVGKPWPEVRELLGEMIYEEPTGGYSSRDKYLSGNIREKLKDAQAAANLDKRFQANVEALTAAIPRDLKATEVQVPIGARWVPTETYSDFAKFLFADQRAEVRYLRSTDSYKIAAPGDTAEMNKRWGTSRMSGDKILQNVLHNKYPVINDYDEFGKPHLNEKATEQAREKFDEIRNAFDDWIWRDTNRRESLLRLYNDRFNSTVLRKYDGQHLSFEGMNNGIQLLPHQKDAIWMIAQNSGGIIDHIVGAGKTYVMIAGVMTLRRQGVAKKPMIMALKSTIPQIVESFKYAYPNAKILFPREKDFSPKNRKKMLASIANNDWDAIIISHDNYKMIPQDQENQQEIIQEEVDNLDRDIEEMRAAGGSVDKQVLKGLEKRKNNLEVKLEELLNTPRDKEIKTFQELGIDHVMVDESQQFKNLQFSTKMSNIAGMGDPNGSARAFNLYVGIRSLHKLHKGDKGVTFLSGTPISNSMSEIYLLLKYMRQDYLNKIGIYSYDSWINSFARNSFEVEFSVAGGMTTKNRFRELVNVPEMSIMYREIADVRDDSNLKLDKPDPVHELISLKKSPEQEQFFNALLEFAKSKGKNAGQLRAMGVVLKGDTEKAFMLRCSTLANKASLDLRLVNPRFSDYPDNKTSIASKRIADIYRESNDHKGTQLVFADMGTPKTGNKSEDVFNYMQDYLGIPKDDMELIFGTAEKKPSISDVIQNIKDVLEWDDKKVEDMMADADSFYVFDVYNDLKKKLIKEGIPENEIGFIHDYNTDVKKERLFEQVNAGKVRVVIGSTQKLGTGVNAQKKLIALHHLDIQWKPADMEQRNGRLIRQGANLAKEKYDNKARIFYYGTELTLDAFRYQLVHTKSKMIKDFKNGALGSREIDEGGEDVDLADFVSSLSGDPKIKQLAVTEKNIEKLRRSKKNFAQDQYDAEANIKNYKSQISMDQKVIALYKQDMAVIDANTTKNEAGEEVYQIKIGDKFFDKPGEAGKELVEINNKLSSELRSGSPPVLVATYKGLPLYIERGVSLSTGTEAPIKWYVKGVSGINYHPTGTEQMYIDPIWAGRYAQESINRIPASLKRKEDDIQKNTENIRLSEEVMGKQWDKGPELAAEEEKQKELNKYFQDLAKNGPPTEEKPEDEEGGDDEMPDLEKKTGQQKAIHDKPGTGAKSGTAPQEGFVLSDAIKKAMKELGIPFGEKYLPSSTLGIYKHRSNSVRVRSIFDVFVLAHEATHFFDKKHGIGEKVIADTTRGDQLRKDLTKIYVEFYPKAKKEHSLKKRVTEGLAVLIENYFYDPDYIAKNYKELVDTFIQPGGSHYYPDIGLLLEKMNDVSDQWASLTPEQRMASLVARGDEVVKSLANDTGFTFAQKAEFTLFNRAEPLQRYARAAGISKTADDPFVAFMNLLNKDTIASSWIKGKGLLVLNKDANGFDFIPGVSAEKYAKMIKGRELEFDSYLVSRRVVEENNRLQEMRDQLRDMDPDDEAYGPLVSDIARLDEVIKNDNISLSDALATVASYEKEFEQPVNLYDKINESLADFMYNAGMISSATRLEYSMTKGYAAFQRMIVDDLLGGMMGTGSSAVPTKIKATKGRKGGQHPIISPVYSQIMSISETIGKSMNNVMWNKVVDMGKENPEIARRLDLQKTVRVVDDEGRISYPQDGDAKLIKVFTRGVRYYYKMAPEFIAVSHSLRPAEYSTFGRMLSMPTAIFTRLTTSANPFWAVGNFTIDQVTSLMQTETGLIPIIDPIESLAKALAEFANVAPGEEQLFHKYLAMGGERQTLSDYYKVAPSKAVNKLAGDVGLLQKGLDIVELSVNALEMPSNLSEYITRFSEFARAKAKGMSDFEAMYHAANVTVPFQLSGYWGGDIGQKWVRAMAYFNASMQVFYKFSQTAKDHPERMATIAAGLIAAALTSAILMMRGADDKTKRYLSNMEARELSRALFFPKKGGGLYRIRIPEQIGAITGVVYLEVIAKYGGNKVRYDDYVDAITAPIPDQFNILDPKKIVVAWTPQALKPSLEVAFNTKVYPNLGPIVPDYMLQEYPTEPEKQYTDYTSEVAKDIGKILNVSPMKVDFWVKNQFGAVGGMFVGKMPNWPIVRQEEHYQMSGRAYNNFYEDQKAVDAKYNDVVQRTKDGRPVGDNEILISGMQKALFDQTRTILALQRKGLTYTGTLPESIRDKSYKLIVDLYQTDYDKVDEKFLNKKLEEASTLLQEVINYNLAKKVPLN